jgi:serine/threonine-protein kinase SRPK3
VFRVVEFDRYTEDDIYRLFGKPETGPLETESGETPGAEAPRYIVKSLDFLSSETDIISNDISLIDFDQAFLVSSPPGKMLATPMEFLAPEVAVGRPASPASDVWALGCSIVRLRDREGLFSAYDITSPAELMRGIIQALGDMPTSWEDTLFDSDGQPTKDPAKGKPVWKFTDKQPIKERVYRIWDNPSSRASKSTKALAVSQGENLDQVLDWESHKPYPRCFLPKFWKPTAIKVGDVYLSGNHDESDNLLEALPKIPEDEAALLYDLLSKIFVYEPSERVSVEKLLDHPWFHMDDQN